MIFYDWISCHQKHDGHLPVICSKVKEQYDYDHETGCLEQDYSILTAKSIKGSFESSCLVRCDGNTVYFSGNPSRWNRLDNLVGLDSLERCFLVINKILADLGLPPFTKAKMIGFSTEKNKDKAIYTGCIINRIDITQNFSVGRGNEIFALRELCTISLSTGNAGYRYPDGRTVMWYYNPNTGKGSRRKNFKIYDKATQLRAFKKQYEDDADNQYVEDVINFCSSCGVLRAELSLKSMELERLDYKYFGLFNENELKNQLTTHYEKIMKPFNHEQIPHEKIYEYATTHNIFHKKQIQIDCIDENGDVVESKKKSFKVYEPLSNSRAARAQGIVDSWLKGREITPKSIGHTAFAEYKAILSQCGGIDISIPIKTEDAIQMFKPILRIIEVKPLTLADMPAFYKAA